MIEILRNRRSVRKFKNKFIEPEKIEILNEALLRSPSSRGINPWEFILVTNKELLNKLSVSKKHGTDFIKTAPAAYVICADTKKTDVWIEDCSIAAIILQLTGETLGLKSCWAQIRNRPHDDNLSAEDYIKNLLKIPDDYAIVCIIGLGYPDEEKQPHSKEELDYNKIHLEEF
jgi:nitroreductase